MSKVLIAWEVFLIIMYGMIGYFALNAALHGQFLEATYYNTVAILLVVTRYEKNND